MSESEASSEEKCEQHNKYFFEHTDEEKAEDNVQTGVTNVSSPEGSKEEQFSGPDSDWTKYTVTQPAMASTSKCKIRGKRITEPIVAVELTFDSLDDAVKVAKSLSAFGITDLVLTTD